MSLRRGFLVGLLAVASLLAATAAIPAVGAAPAKPVPPEDGAGVPGSQPEAVPGELLVRFDPGTSASARARALAAAGAEVQRPLPGVADLVLARTTAGRSAPAAIAALQGRSEVRYAEPNFVVHADKVPNDSRLPELWGLHNTGQTVNGVAGTADADIDAPEAWNATTGGTSVTVAVLDTGIAFDHPDLAANMWVNPGEVAGNGTDDDGNGFVDDVRGWDFINNDNDPGDEQGHGTHVAGTIAARGDNDVAGAGTTDVVGVNWQSKLMALRVLGADGRGSNAALISAAAYAQRNGAKVGNMSLSGSGTSQALADAFTNAPSVLFAAAAGNGGADGVGDNNESIPAYPCNLTNANIVCVAATGQTDALTGFSNFGATSVDLAAPGSNILSTVPATRTIVFSDTFETALTGRWTTGGTPNTWNRSTEGSTTGFRLTDSPGASYVNRANNWARTTNGINLSGRRGCTVDYTLQIDAESGFDFLEVEATRTPTVEPWTRLTNWTGTGTVSAITSLGSFSGQTGVFLRFRLRSDGIVTRNGAWIDNLAVRCISSSYTASNYAFFNGTSMATPHVAGVAALIRTRFPFDNVASVRGRLLAAVDTKASLSGKVVTGGRVNAYKAVASSTASVASGVLTYTAGAGTRNNVTVTRFTDTDGVAKYRIRDPFSAAGNVGSRITPGAGCVRVNDTEVKCNVAGITRVRVIAGDLDDTANLSTITIPVTLEGGTGADGLTGGTAGDILTGGLNADRFSGGGGNDVVNARNDDVDTSFSCGESTGDTDTVNADATPDDPVTASATNCEVVNKA